MTPAPEPSGDALLEARGLSKSFPGVQALDRVDFTLRRGQIHALLGENGAGKSTLLKLLTGVHRRDAGTIRLEGRLIAPASPRHAESLGISTVFQEVNLLPHLSIAENIVLGREPTRFGLIRWREVERRASAALARLSAHADSARLSAAAAPVVLSCELGACSLALQQRVAIARALDLRARVLILDEPTSSLDAEETAELFVVLRRLRDQGLGILFVTHFLDQVYEVADAITVLRDGRRVGEFETARLPRLELVRHMLGRTPDEVAPALRGRRSLRRRPRGTGSHPVASVASTLRGRSLVASALRGRRSPRGRRARPGPRFPPPAPRSAAGAPLLEARGLGRRGAVDAVNLAVASGEVVGLAGLLGSGRSEVARLLFGIDRADRGSIVVDGRPARIRAPRDAVRCGLALTPEDRKTQGLLPSLSVRENILLALQARRGAWRRVPLREQRRIVQRFVAALRIRTPSPETPVGRLSGGNQQKVLLARWLATDPRVLILDEPTRGIDLGAKAEIAGLIAALRREGRGVLLISSELEELVRLCDRLVVLRDRRQVGELAGPALSEQAVMAAIASPARTDSRGSSVVEGTSATEGRRYETSDSRGSSVVEETSATEGRRYGPSAPGGSSSPEGRRNDGAAPRNDARFPDQGAQA